MEELARLIIPLPPVQMRPPRLQVRHSYWYGWLLISQAFMAAIGASETLDLHRKDAC